MPNGYFVKSRVNGLIVGIPADARGILPRYSTRGGNELVFAELDRREVVNATPAQAKRIHEQNERMTSKLASVRQAAVAGAVRKGSIEPADLV